MALTRLIGKVNFQFPAKMTDFMGRSAHIAVIPPPRGRTSNTLTLLGVPENVRQFETSVRAWMVTAHVSDSVVGFCVANVPQYPSHAAHGCSLQTVSEGHGQIGVFKRQRVSVPPWHPKFAA